MNSWRHDAAVPAGETEEVNGALEEIGQLPLPVPLQNPVLFGYMPNPHIPCFQPVWTYVSSFIRSLILWVIARLK